MNVVGCEKDKVHREVKVGIGKGVAINGNELGVKLKSKKSKAQSCKIGVVMHANKMACPLVEKLDFLHMNLRLMTHLGRGDLDHRAWSNTIYWHIYNPCLMWWLKFLG